MQGSTPPPAPGRKGTTNGWSIPVKSITGGRKPMLHPTPTPTPPNIELLRYISCYLARFIYFPLKYNLNTSFVCIMRHFRYRQLLKHVVFHDRRARRGLRLRDETTGNPGSVIVPQYGSSKITVFVWGKNIILKFLGNTK